MEISSSQENATINKINKITSDLQTELDLVEKLSSSSSSDSVDDDNSNNNNTISAKENAKAAEDILKSENLSTSPTTKGTTQEDEGAAVKKKKEKSEKNNNNKISETNIDVLLLDVRVNENLKDILVGQFDTRIIEETFLKENFRVIAMRKMEVETTAITSTTTSTTITSIKRTNNNNEKKQKQKQKQKKMTQACGESWELLNQHNNSSPSTSSSASSSSSSSYSHSHSHSHSPSKRKLNFSDTDTDTDTNTNTNTNTRYEVALQALPELFTEKRFNRINASVPATSYDRNIVMKRILLHTINGSILKFDNNIIFLQNKKECEKMIMSNNIWQNEDQIDKIKNYYGTEIALYHTWLQFYRNWLIIPSIIGFFLFLWQFFYQEIDNICLPIFCILLATWSTLFLEFWNKENSVIIETWDIIAGKKTLLTGKFSDKKQQRRRRGGGRLKLNKRTIKKATTSTKNISNTEEANSDVGADADADADVSSDSSVSSSSSSSLSSSCASSFCASPKSKKNNIIIFYDAFYTMEEDMKNKLKNTFLRQICVTIPIHIAIMIIQIKTFLFFTSWTTSAEKKYPETFFAMVPNLIYSVIPILYGQIYQGYIVKLLNTFEAHDSRADKENSLIVKLFLFQFFNYFGCLFYIAFGIRNIEKLREMLITLLVTKQIINNFMELGLPFIKKKIILSGIIPKVMEQCKDILSFDKKYNNKKDEKDSYLTNVVFCVGTTNIDGNEIKENINSNENNNHAREEMVRNIVKRMDEVKYLPEYTIYDDYLELAIQFGYISMFSVAFPLGPLLALVNNTFEGQVDLVKMSTTCRRYISKKNVKSIGPWQKILTAIGFIAISTNCLLMGLVSEQLDNYLPDKLETKYGRLIMCIVIEHILFAVIFVLREIIAVEKGSPQLKKAVEKSVLYHTQQKVLSNTSDDDNGKKEKEIDNEKNKENNKCTDKDNNNENDSFLHGYGLFTKDTIKSVIESDSFTSVQ